MANRRKPPRKSSGHKKQDSHHKQGGGKGGQGGKFNKRRQGQGQSNRQQEQVVASKISETMKELPKRKPPEGEDSSRKSLFRFIAVVVIILVFFFGYFICREYQDKTPVYGKRGWDETAHKNIGWKEASDHCTERGKRLPDREQLRTFSKRADAKLKALGIFWSSTPEGDSGYYNTVNLKNGEIGSSPVTMKFSAICVK
ncbi:hypothetical protein CH373_17360 [Leptospira perolatii]|uniref:DUF1566 domain-containing protein n=1 Tax=Leptospira perolatii TaxID=2023191 RepID=A0A2M9ZIP5_9LEPT|nr:hypothetical protein [Leptospira perolatii]PJZ68356.1 hypothetical protein CH360_16645 [Leptospira perolatii]PJZ71844.1 hypothetical protein CH373_17360 [Leptospira perolatii]